MMEREVAAKGGRSIRASRKAAAKRGLAVPRTFTSPGVDPAEELAWEVRHAQIAGEGGAIVFEQ